MILFFVWLGRKKTNFKIKNTFIFLIVVPYLVMCRFTMTANVSVYATSCVYILKLIGFTQLIACITDMSVWNEFAGISTLSWFGI